MDCDNAVSDPLVPDIPKEDWKTVDDVRDAFPNVKFYVVYSRNNMKEKNGKPARPKFHVYFPLKEYVASSKIYSELKKKMWAKFPQFDDKALDASCFLFGVENPKVEFYDGDLCVDEYINQKSTEIVEGARNSTMSRFVSIILKKYGDEDGRVYEAFLEESKKCVPPLDDEELMTIWNSAENFYNSKIKNDDNYVPPNEYNNMYFCDYLVPNDFTDIGKAKAFIAGNKDRVAYVAGLGLMYYNGKLWRDNDKLVQKSLQKFTDKQLVLAWKMRNEAQTEEDEEKAEAFYKFVLSPT